MIKALQKAVAGKEPSANIITILEKLKKDVAATEDLLRVSFFDGRAWHLTASGLSTQTHY